LEKGHIINDRDGKGNTHNNESSRTSDLPSISPAPLSEAAWPVLIGAAFFSGFIFQPSTLSLHATLPNFASTILVFAAKEYNQTSQITIIQLKKEKQLSYEMKMSIVRRGSKIRD